METLWKDIRYGLRMLRKDAGFTMIAVLTLALGIGANSGIFSVMRQVLLERLPVPHPEELVLLYAPGPKTGHISSDEVDGSESFSYPMYKDLRDRSTVFAGLASKADFPVSVAFRGQTERAEAELVSGNYFDTLEVHPAIGRLLLPTDTATEGGSAVVVLGQGYWKKRFGGDPSVLNQTMLVNNQLMTVVGVVQPGFNGVQLGQIPDVYIPVTMKAEITPNWNGMNDHNDYWIKVIGRLKRGISVTEAAASLAPIYHALLENELPLNTGLSERDKKEFLTKKINLHNGARGRPLLANQTRDQLLALTGMVGLVWFIACANIAGLLTARGAARQKEIGVRLSLGAGRWRLVRQLVIESCLLSFAGALLGLVVASWMSRALVQFASANDMADGLLDSLNLPVLLFTAVLSIASGVLFGVAPALKATGVELASTLKEQVGSLSLGLTHTRLRRVLVVAQVALTLLLVTSASEFVQSLYNLKHVDLGLQPDHVLQFSIAPMLNGYDQAHSLRLYRGLEDRISALPGVVSLSGSEQPLIADSTRGSDVTIEGVPADFAGERHVQWNAIGAAHFANLRIPLLNGREFTRQDGPETPKVAIINETMAETFFPHGDAIGKHMKFGGGSGPLNMEIVGIVRDSHHSDARESRNPFLYVPYTQQKAPHSLTYYVRTSAEPASLASSIRQIVSELDASLPVYDVRTFEEQIDHRLSEARLVAILALAFGALAALLAAMGIYGLLAYTVTQRTREIGLRMALGAEAMRVGWMILGDVAVVAGTGVALGIPLSYGLGKLVSSLLFGLKGFNFVSVGIALLALTAVAAIATYGPARRATQIDPMVALRYE